MARRKGSPGAAWARQHLLHTQDAMTAWNFQERLEESQWYTADQHLAFQFRHLAALVAHARANVPHYRRTLAGFDGRVTPDTWHELPVLTRAEVQGGFEDLKAETYPRDHGPAVGRSSSGSTGAPVTILHSDVSATWHKALTLRAQLWAVNRFDRKLAAIRQYSAEVASYPDGFEQPRWAEELILPFETGPVVGLRARTPIPDQFEWLQRQRPQVLITFPTNLEALAHHALDNRLTLPGLKRIMTVAEAHPEGLRGTVRRAFGAEIADAYSATETGEIAIQCPDSEAYHVQSEAHYVEVLDEAGQPCRPGETGRVVVTPLHNFAMPLIRYAIGDYATVGKRCRCGRGLPVLSRVLGRQRNMMRLPDGSQIWPSFGVKRIRGVAPVRQAQFLQHDATHLEARLVADRALTADEEDAIRKLIAARMPFDLDVRFSYPAEIARSASGKHEDFICLMDRKA